MYLGERHGKPTMIISDSVAGGGVRGDHRHQHDDAM
jgi:hypothetical protein